MESPELFLFTWLHLSDIHFRHGTPSVRWDQRLVLRKLQEDVEASIRDSYKPDVVLITGDIAYTGDANSNDPIQDSDISESTEYTAAGNWLSELSASIGIDNQKIYIVPGNHDIQRNVATANRSLQRLLDNLREGRESIDEVLDRPDERCALASRMKNFIQFSRHYAPGCLSDSLSEDFLYWQHSLKTTLGFGIRLIGLNTAILSADNSDKKKLFLGSEQLGRLIYSENNEQNDLVVVLSHHPFSWLNDEKNVDAWVQGNCHVHLYGHLHENDAKLVQSGGGATIINLGAGAVHTERDDTIRYGYTRASIIANSSENKIKLRVWSRSWSDKNKDFRADTDNTPAETEYAEYDLNLRYFDHASIKRKIDEMLSTPIKIAADANEEPLKVKVHVRKVTEDFNTASSDLPPVVPAWVGREAELELLNDPALKVIAITGIGGQGKSALASHYIRTLSQPASTSPWDWRDCREHGDTLQTHILRVIERLSAGRISAASFLGEEFTSIVDCLFDILGDSKWVFVFDNIDHYVNAELEQPIHGMKYLIESSLNEHHNARFIFTCRPSLVYDDNSFFQISLSGLTVAETQRLFELRGVVIDSPHIKRNIADAQMVTQGHPLWLNLIATQVAKNKANISSLLADIRKGKNNIGLPVTMLRSIWKTLNDKQRWVLRCMAEAVRPETEEQLSEYLSSDLNWNQFSKALKSLKSLDLVVTKTASNSKDTLELHPVVRTFIATEFPKSEREKFIIKIANIFDKIIIKLKGTISSGSSIYILEHWTFRAELAMNAGNYIDALQALADVSAPILAAGHFGEFVRVSKRLFEELNFTTAIVNEYRHFDNLFASFIDALSQLEQFEEAEQFLLKYEEIITGKDARYINLCDMRCFLNWIKHDNDTAIYWGENGVNLKKSANLDTHFDCNHNLALAHRDNGEIDLALEYFLKDNDIADVINPDNIIKEYGGHYYGNIGRCLWLKGEVDKALVCYKKSASLLEYEGDKSSAVNRGWASLWIAEALKKQGQITLSWYFYRRAYHIWQDLSPSRAKEALTKSEEIVAAHKELANSEEDYQIIERKCRSWIESK